MVQRDTEVHMNAGLPRDLRLRIDELRLARARRDGGRPPSVKTVMVEALEALIAREATR
jgi:hypothetical protein